LGGICRYDDTKTCGQTKVTKEIAAIGAKMHNNKSCPATMMQYAVMIRDGILQYFYRAFTDSKKVKNY
jgi:hypothetical protein